jgi:hypothetical protein
MPYFVGGLVIIAVLLHLTPFDVLINRRRNAGATPAAHVSVSADCAGAVTSNVEKISSPNSTPFFLGSMLTFASRELRSIT